MIIYIGNYQSKHGITVTMCEQLAPLFSEKYKVVTSSDKKNPILRMLDMLYTVFKNRKKAKLILIDSYSTLNFWYTYLIAKEARFFGIKYIPILHGGKYESRLNRSPKASKFIFSNSYKNISPSVFLQEIFKKSGFDSIHINNSFNISNYNFKERKTISPKVLWVRQIAPVYNPMLALKAVAILKKEYPLIELCMVGPANFPDFFSEFQALVKSLDIENNVKLTGKLTKEEWIKLSEKYDIFINTTNSDNQPLSVIEAMALGLPQISTNAGGLPYLINNKIDGLVINVGDEVALANAIREYLINPLQAYEYSIRARKKVEDFDWSIVRNKWFDVFEEAFLA